MLSKITLVDFFDSFTLNIAEVLESLNYSVEVISWDSFCSHFSYLEHDLIVLGPGPGHVDDYPFSKELNDYLVNQKVLGICLGHQILLKKLGHKLVPLENPLHGKSLDLGGLGDKLKLADLRGQFYNSWQILYEKERAFLDSEVSALGDMVIYFQWKNWVSVQFHPESVGTSCPQGIFQKLLAKIV